MSVINTNVSATIASNSLTRNERAMSTAMERLSTGMRINSAKDDAAGLAISSRMTSQIRGLNQAVRNANDGISMLQTAEGATNEITNMLQRMRELAVQSRSDTNTQETRDYMQLEFAALNSEITRIAENTQWNTMNIMDGSFAANGDAGKFEFQVGANAGQVISATIGNFTAINGLQQGPVATADVSLKVAVDAKTAASIDPRVIDFTGTAPEEDQIFFVTIGSGSDAAKISYTAAAGDALGDVLDGLKTAIELSAFEANGTDALALDVAVVGNSLVLTTTDTVGGAGDLDISVSSFKKLATDTDDNPVGNPLIDLTANRLTIDMEGTEVEAGQKFQLTIGNVSFEYEAKVGDDIAKVAAGLAQVISGSTDFEEAVVATSAGSTLLIQHGDDEATATFTMADKSNTAVTAADVFFTTGSTISNNAEMTIATSAGAEAAISSLDKGIQFVNSERAVMGATINRLEYAADNLTSISQSTEASRSRIQDADYAKETTELARAQIIAQAGTAMLAQANQVKQTVLSLLK